MSAPHLPWDPDPLTPGELDEAYAFGFEDGWTSTKPRPLLALVLAALSGALVGAALMWVVR